MSKMFTAIATLQLVGFGVHGDDDWQEFGHNGGAPGMSGELRIFPRQGYVLIALSSRDPLAASRGGV